MRIWSVSGATVPTTHWPCSRVYWGCLPDLSSWGGRVRPLPPPPRSRPPPPSLLGRQTPQEADPPVNRITDVCKNITFAALLRNAVSKKGFKLAASSLREQIVTIVPARHRLETGSLNLPLFMLQWFIRFLEFAEFTEFLSNFGENSILWCSFVYFSLEFSSLFHTHDYVHNLSISRNNKSRSIYRFRKGKRNRKNEW